MLSWIEKPGLILISTKAIRVFAYGFMSLLLPFYLSYLNFSLQFIGIVITISILSGAIFNIFIGIYGEKIGRRSTLQIFSLFMIFSSILFILGNEISIIIASIFGVISVTGTETGPFLTVEQAALTKFVRDEKRTLLFSIYNFMGYTFSALGSLFSGIASFIFGSVTVFYILLSIFGVIGLLLFILYSMMGNFLEIKFKGERVKLSKDARSIVLKLSILFSIDAFGGGFIVQSIISLWFKVKFNILLSNQGW
ncbi:MAG: MFS transporter, partial [Thermoplasmata archaeon]